MASPNLRTPAAGPSPAVLEELGRMEAQFQNLRDTWRKQSSEVTEAHQRIAELEETNDGLAQQLARFQARLEEEHVKAERQRERANQLTEILAEIHGSLFTGGTYELILRACLTITGSARGLYVVSKGADEPLQVRAAIGIEGEPTAFVREVCRMVLSDGEPFVANDTAELRESGLRLADDERYENCLAVPVLLMKSSEGILFVADKEAAPFDDHDVDTLITLGSQAGVAVENARLQGELQQVHLKTIGLLADLADTRDAYAPGRGEYASRIARATAAKLGLPETQQTVVGFAALLRDVGKLALDEGLLFKPAPLLPEEKELMHAHVRIGSDLLSRVAELGDVAEAVLHHHERWDGHGYPSGLKGEDIPMNARIVAVVDAWCAMTARRSYRLPLSEDDARRELESCAGAHLDPRVVKAFVQALAEEPAPIAVEPEGTVPQRMAA